MKYSESKSPFNIINLAMLFVALFLFSTHAISDACPEWLNHDMKRLHKSESVNLCEETRGKAIMIVNTASHCGYTPQLSKLEKIHQAFSNKNLAVIGVASNSFKQEAGNEEKIAGICYINYGVSFTMLAPVDVKGDSAHALFKSLAAHSKAPAWNFNKYLISQDRSTIKHLGSRQLPSETELQRLITPSAIAPKNK